jgi:hypothetical protein
MRSAAQAAAAKLAPLKKARAGALVRGYIGSSDQPVCSDVLGDLSIRQRCRPSDGGLSASPPLPPDLSWASRCGSPYSSTRTWHDPLRACLLVGLASQRKVAAEKYSVLGTYQYRRQALWLACGGCRVVSERSASFSAGWSLCRPWRLTGATAGPPSGTPLGSQL